MDDYLEDVKRKHDSYVNYLPIETGRIQPVVLDSWARCRGSAVDPKAGTGSPLPHDEIARRREFNRSLVQVASSQMHAMYSTVRGSGFVVNLIDRDGYILDMVGDPEIVYNARALNFEVGSNWSELAVGTNAISLALDNCSPVQVAGAEHYCYSHHTWTCSAAPICGPDGVLIGVLNMSAPARFRHPHTLGMIISGASSIQAQLQLLYQSEQVARSRDKLSAILESVSEGLLCVDNQGRVTRINSRLAHQLGVVPEQMYGADITSLGIPRAVLRELTTGCSLRYRELQLPTPRGSTTFYISAEPVHEPMQLEQEFILVFHGTKKTRRLVHQVMGNRAHYTFSRLITHDPRLQEAVSLGRTVAYIDSSVVLQGESGTGKEIFAQAIHNEGPRRSEPFVAINCAAIPRELMESELFGYEAGAFSGANKNGSIGKFELADGGTLFLDELAEMAMDLQVKLLRVLQEKVLYRVGGKQAIPVDVRIIAASNKNLAKCVGEGSFREDLYYRLNVFNIALPALRERREDIRLLAKHFLTQFSEQHARPVSGFTEDAMEHMLAHRWPGNVRELQNVVERAIMTARGSAVELSDLPDYLHAAESDGGCLDRPNSIRDAERSAIEHALDDNDGNVTRAARQLRIGRNTLYRKLRKYGITSAGR